MIDSGFEIKFAQLVEARVQEMIPSLSNHKVGFQLIEKNEDDTRGLGVMAFMVNGAWLYIPCFFLAGKLKMPCLYIKRYDMRVPLNDSWVSFVKSSTLDTLGHLVPMDSVKVDQSKADLMTVIGKMASESNSVISRDDLQGMLSASPCPDTSITGWIKDNHDKESFFRMVEAMESDDDFANAIFRYYSPAELRKTAAALDDYFSKLPVETSPVRTITKESAEAPSLSDKEKLVLMKEGQYIKDDRKETSLVYKRTEVPETGFSSPGTSGFYEILLSDGETAKGIVVFPKEIGKGAYLNTTDIPETASERSDNAKPKRVKSARCAVIMESSPNKFLMMNPSDIMVKSRKDVNKSEVKGSGEYRGDRLSLRKLAESDCRRLMLVDANGNAFCLQRDGSQWPQMYFTDKPGRLHVRNGTLMVPDEVLAFEESDFTSGETVSRAVGGGEEEKKSGPRPSSFGDLNVFVRKCMVKTGMEDLKIYHDNETGYRITSDRSELSPTFRKTSAMEYLVYKHGIRASEAEAMLKEASEHGPRPNIVRYMVKHSEGMYDMSTEMGTVPYNTSENVESDTVVSPEGMTQLAVKAADTGLKEVLDTSVMATLTGTSRSLSKVGEMLPDLIKALDRLGSIICLFYWNNETFEEQYGRVELIELEEKLLDVFSSLGDLTLFLKEKTVDSDTLFDGNKGNISEDLGEV